MPEKIYISCLLGRASYLSNVPRRIISSNHGQLIARTVLAVVEFAGHAFHVLEETLARARVAEECFAQI